MAELPTGTVTFVFTDIEGSTGLLTRLGEGYREVLEAHNRLLRENFSAGVEVSTEGDAFFIAYTAAPQAVAEAVEAQRAIANASWPEGVEVRVRIGMHTGEAVRGADNYVGVDVNRTSRIMAAAHGGQIVVSAATHALSDKVMAGGITFSDLGEHLLRDMPAPERLYQVVAEGLPADFPALHSVDARPNNLPIPLTTFIGRGREIGEIKEGLAQARLLTLTGPGGTGKTRLSIQAAHDLLPSFEDGAFFVPLAPITDPALVTPTIGEVLGVREAAARSPLEQLIEQLHRSEVLIVLDNLEQVVEAATDIGQLLSGTEKVRIIATSREPLGLQGEREYPVPPLELPDTAHLPSFESLSQFTAVELFIQRAAAVRPGFEVTNENAPAVAEICSSLDGLPLAIELAAARVKILSPEEILQRLEDRLGFLTGGGRDRPGRQQTLRGAIAWSYDLLDEGDRALFSSLAAFSRGFRLEAAEAVCGQDGSSDVFDGVASLVNQSLIRQVEGPGGESRFLMLETIREFAAERLDESPEAEAVRRRHAEYFLELATRAAPNLFGPDQPRWLGILAAEHDNFRGALAWAEAGGEVELAMQLSAALWRFWQMHGHLREAGESFARILALPGTDDHPEAKAAALEGAGGVAYWMVETQRARDTYEECLEIRRRIGDPRGIAEAAYNLSFPYTFTRQDSARDEDRARALQTEAVQIFRELEDDAGIAKALWAIGDLEYELRNYEEALPFLVEALDRQRGLDDRFGQAWSLFVLGVSEINLGRLDEAEEHLLESLSILSEGGDVSGIPLLLAGVGALAAERGDSDKAIRLAAAAEAAEKTGGGGLAGVNERIEGWEETRKRLKPDEREYQRLWEEGAAMAMNDAVAYALGEEKAQPEVP